MNTTSGSEDDDPLREPRAYNLSIYLMVAMPYSILGLISFRVYLGYRATAKRSPLLRSVQEGAVEPEERRTDSNPSATPRTD